MPENQFKPWSAISIIIFIAGLAIALAWLFFNNRQPLSTGLTFYNESLPASRQISDTSIPLKIKDPIRAFNFSGQVELKGDNSLIRAILVDSDKKEYLVYETYFSTAEQKNFKIDNVCDETCSLPNVKPAFLKLRIINASLKIGAVYFSNSNAAGSDPMSAADYQRKNNLKKIEALNKKNKQQGLEWTAGETSISNFTYEEKKKLFSNPDGTPVKELPNLQGLEYYRGGVFEFKSDKSSGGDSLLNPFIRNILDKLAKINFKSMLFSETASAAVTDADLPDHWDWHKAHGENWMTSVKNQGNTNNCTIFSKAANVEAAINLYYNRHLDVDLSEQMYYDCAVMPDENTIMEMHNKTMNYYFADEACDPYIALDNRALIAANLPTNDRCNYNNICADWNSRMWRVYNYINVNDATEAGVKKDLINYGPLDGVVKDLGHAMSLVGYETDSGGTIWIFKNSWGPNWGDPSDPGYFRLRTKLSNLFLAYSATGNGGLYATPSGASYSVSCVDKDNDGYCNWGIGTTKPSNCPASCQNQPERDYDDSNQTITTAGTIPRMYVPLTPADIDAAKCKNIAGDCCYNGVSLSDYSIYAKGSDDKKIACINKTVNACLPYGVGSFWLIDAPNTPGIIFNDSQHASPKIDPLTKATFTCGMNGYWTKKTALFCQAK